MGNPFQGFYDAQDKHKASRRQFEDVDEKLREQGMRFFERLALLHGAALTLSITFVGLFLEHASPVQQIIVLHCAWGAFLVGLLASLYRNYSLSHYQWRATQAMLAGDAAAVVQEMSRMHSAEDKRKELEKYADLHLVNKRRQDKMSKGFWRCYVFSEYAAHFLLIAGLALLTLFAVLNTA